MTTTDLPPPTDRDAAPELVTSDSERSDSEQDDVIVLEVDDDLAVLESPEDRDDAPDDAPDRDWDDAPHAAPHAAPDAAMGTGVVDPRMRERWVTARRVEGRRRLRALVALVSAASLLGIAYLVVRSPLLGVDTIQVRGNQRTPIETVRGAAHISDGEPLLFLDTQAVARRIEALPGIAHASVRTDLPTTVVITVTERRPVAWIRSTGANPFAAVDGAGRVLDRSAQAPVGLPEVVGAGTTAVPGHGVSSPAPFRGLAALPEALRIRTVRFELRQGSGVLTIDGAPPTAGEIQFGPITDMARKGAAALAVLDVLAGRGERVAVLDVRVPDAPATK